MADEIVPRPKVRVFHPEGGRVMTKQADAAESDVNAIMARWISHGVVRVTGQQPAYGDFSKGIDYLAGLSRIRQVEQDFSTLPAAVRDHVHNDPAEFLELVFNPDRRKELVEVGLLPKDLPPAAPQEVIVVAPAVEPEPAPAPSPAGDPAG